MRTRSPASSGAVGSARVTVLPVGVRRMISIFVSCLPAVSSLAAAILCMVFDRPDAGRERFRQHRNLVAYRCQFSIEFLASILSEFRLLLFRLVE